MKKPNILPRIICKTVDNLELLLSQPDESVDLIYCDILYGTGRNFGDYQDLKPIRTEIENHYLPRLTEMKRVLKQNGSIYLQMDTRINHWMRILMDDVFGYENFRNEISWCYNSGGGARKYFSKKHDIVIFYTKSNDYLFNADSVRVPYSETIDYGISTINRYNPLGKIPFDYWNINVLGQNDKTESVDYPTQKPKKLVQRIILASSNEGDVVADYYLGSGTTAVVCKELNRHFIGCDINPKAIEITNSRLCAVS